MIIPSARIYCKSEEDVRNLANFLSENKISWDSGYYVDVVDLLRHFRHGYRYFTINESGKLLRGKTEHVEFYEYIEEDLFNIPMNDFLSKLNLKQEKIDTSSLFDLL